MKNRTRLIGLILLILITTYGCGLKPESNNQNKSKVDIPLEPTSAQTNQDGISDTPLPDDKKQEESSIAEKNDELSLTDEVTPEITEKPETKNISLYLNIVNEANLILAKYDIGIRLDDNSIGIVKNGDRYTEQVVVGVGTHKIKFINSNDEKIVTEYSFDVDSEATIEISLKAHIDSIEILKSNLTKGIEENEVTIPDFCGYMLPVARKELEVLGVENIKTTVNSNEFIIDEKNWIIFSQNIDPGSKMDRYGQITLVCGRIKDFVDTYMFRKPLKEVLNLGNKYGFTIELIDDQTGTKVSINNEESELNEWTIVSYSAPSNNTKKVTYNLAFGGIGKVPSVIGMTVSKARKELQKEHFTNISLTNDDNATIKNEKNWIVVEQSVEAGTEYSVLETIVLKVEKTKDAEKDDKTGKSVYYSTNDKDTVGNGNTGVYAYISTGGTYKNYYIIDFDKGYVYFFSDGNGDGTCDKVKIDSGDLNNVVMITYHDVDGSKWSYGLHFKWKYRPENLVLQDQYGYEINFVCTDIENALKIRDTKKIIEY